jgi:asparagine synthase (glutamine-hydrolysing)
MCGIFGVWDEASISREGAWEALGTLRHRGPDHSGFLHEGPVWMGTRRLSIIDLEGGDQPVKNEDGRVAAVFNGEIYNYIELRQDLLKRGHQFRTHSDTEVLVHLYEEYGKEMVKWLRGMFAFCIWDSKKRNLFLARDRFGKKPLYYYLLRDPNVFVFGSELKAIRAFVKQGGWELGIRDQSIYDYLSLSIIPQPHTIYEGVEALEPGFGMIYDGDHLTKEEYARLDFSQKMDRSYSEVLKEARDHIADAVKLRLRSDVPLGIFLSGGLDSTIITYEASRVLGNKLHAFTIAARDKMLDESDVATRTAQSLGIQHTLLPLTLNPVESLRFLVPHYDQPFADSSAIPTYEISKLAREYVKVVINGDGGDEMFGGYRRYLAADRMDCLKCFPRGLYSLGSHFLANVQVGRRSKWGFLSRVIRGMSQDLGERYLIWTVDMLMERDKVGIWKKGRMLTTEGFIDSLYPRGLSGLDGMRSVDLKVLLLSALLVKMDMATMAASLEARSPFLDHVLAQFVAQMPRQFLLKGGMTKSILRDAYRGLIPEEVRTAAKRGFEVPLTSWLENEMKDLVHDTLGSPVAKIHSWVDASFLKRLLNREILHDRNWSTLVYSLLVLELWLEGQSDFIRCSGNQSECNIVH